MVIRHEHGAVVQDLQVHRPARNLIPLKPTLCENFVIDRPVVFQPDEGDPVTDGVWSKTGFGRARWDWVSKIACLRNVILSNVKLTDAKLV